MSNIKARLGGLLDVLTQVEHSGGLHTPPELRLFLYALAGLMQAQDVLETGYDAGMTTAVLACSGANVVGVDNLSEYSGVDETARERLGRYKNCTLVEGEALDYLERADGESVDLVFIDDDHREKSVRLEAIQVRRVLRPGGIAVFHDTTIHHLWAILDEVFADWQRVELPCISPAAEANYGVGLVRKPTL